MHYLVRGSATGGDAPVHLFLPNPAGSASNWLDVLAEMPRDGQILAVDLPGTMAGHTASPSRRAAGIEPNARFLLAFIDAVGLDRVVVHGWSAGAMIAPLFAGMASERVAGVVLGSPALPAVLGAGEARLWRTVGRVGLAVVPPILRVLGRRLLDHEAQFLADPAAIGRSRWHTGGDLTRLSPELADVMRDEMAVMQPKRLASWVAAMASLMSLMFVHRDRVYEAMSRTSAPTLVLWGDDDRLIVRTWIDDWLERRPEWTLTVIDGVGHTPPWEAPASYAAAIGHWMHST